MELLVFSETSVSSTRPGPVTAHFSDSGKLSLLQNFLSNNAYWRRPFTHSDLTELFVSSGNASYLYPEGAWFESRPSLQQFKVSRPFRQFLSVTARNVSLIFPRPTPFIFTSMCYSLTRCIFEALKNCDITHKKIVMRALKPLIPASVWSHRRRCRRRQSSSPSSLSSSSRDPLTTGP
jgi:hypothetical protein